ncbi:MAG: segregation/condensation protein A [Eubacterium sp.]|nr:segregation/condensation protein A [Eubacterium sp.]
MNIEVKLEAFEGPLDLLLHLIEKNKVDIYDIPITEITEQYLDYVNRMKEADMDAASEFLVMAATLVSIKSKMLLPPEIDEEGEEIDPRAELVAQLLEYKMVRFLSAALLELQDDAEGVYFKPASLPEELKEPPKIDLDKAVEGIDLENLNTIFKNLMKRQLDRVDKVRQNFGTIEKEAVTLADKLVFVTDYTRRHKTYKFSALIENAGSKIEIVVTFLALLEMIHTGTVRVSQDELFSDIVVESVEAA